MTTQTLELAMVDAIGADGCKVTAGPEYAEAPCGLNIQHSYPVPGAFWPAIQHAHQRHHDLGHESPLILLESVHNQDASVTVSFSCECRPGLSKPDQL